MVRRNLERLSTERQAERRPSMAVNVGELARELEELIAALDRRVPRVAQAGEAAIARDAAALRAKASARLAQIATPAAPAPDPAPGSDPGPDGGDPI
jgi:hypothetical protein